MRQLHILTFVLFSLAASGQAFAVDPTGIPECDNFLSQYETCGLEVLTGGPKLSFEKAIQESAMSFRASASNEEQRKAITQVCIDTHKALKENETPFKTCMNRSMPSPVTTSPMPVTPSAPKP